MYGWCAVPLQGAELGADLVGRWVTEAGVAGEGLLPVAAGLADIPEGLVDTAKAMVGAGLLICVFGLAGQVGRGGELLTGQVELGIAEQRLSETVERPGLAMQLAQLAEDRQRLPLVVGGQLVPAASRFDVTKDSQGLALTVPYLELAEQADSLPLVVGGLTEPRLPSVRD